MRVKVLMIAFEWEDLDVADEKSEVAEGCVEHSAGVMQS